MLAGLSRIDDIELDGRLKFRSRLHMHVSTRIRFRTFGQRRSDAILIDSKYRPLVYASIDLTH